MKSIYRSHSLICLMLLVYCTVSGQPPILGTFRFADNSYVSLGLMDDRSVAIFDNGQVRGIRKGKSRKTYEIGNTIGRFDSVEAVITRLDESTIELDRPGQSKHIGKLVPLNIKEVKFNNGEVSLRGDLILPEGNGPFSCIVFTHGSGPEHKEASYGLAFLMAHHGVAAFVYDKRYVDDKDEKRFEDTFDHYADDAIDAARYVVAHPSIDKSKVGIYGHSQGGWVAPLALSKSKLFSFLIISAGNVVSPVEQHLYNGSCRLRQGGVPEQAIQEIYDFRWIKYEAGITGNKEKYERELPIAKQKPWFERTGGELPQSRFWKLNGFYDSRPALATIRVPVLVLAGEQDRYSETETNMKLFREIFTANTNPDVTYKIFPSANHAFMLTHTGKLDDAELPDLKQFVEGYFDLLVSWVKDRGH